MVSVFTSEVALVVGDGMDSGAAVATGGGVEVAIVRIALVNELRRDLSMRREKVGNEIPKGLEEGE